MKKPLLILLFSFIIHSSLFITHCSAQWVQQTLPVSGTPYDLKFVNANTGWMTLSSPLTFLKTTDGGNSWFTLSSGTTQFGGLKFFNDTLGYSFGNLSGNSVISKTTNGGLNWNIIYSTTNAFVNQSFINPDTGWVCGFDGTLGGIWRTTDACASFQRELTSGSSSMDKIFFLPQRVNGEYIGWCSQSNIFRKTTNSGVTWTQVAPITASREIFFINKDTGWICNGSLFKCTDGGVNWIYEPMPSGGQIISSGVMKFVFINMNTGWGVGGIANYGGSQSRGVIWATTNGGLNWGYQQPDTSINIFNYFVLDFVDSLNGWAFNASGNKDVHTTNGGGQIVFTAINQISTNIPSQYYISQNYPNPFNSSTKINYKIIKSNYVILKIYDILGKEIAILVNQKQNAGTYQIDFDGSNLSSGTYFYILETENFRETRKMIIIK